MSNSTIVIHHLDNSRSQRILWALEELGLEYDIRFYKRDPKTKLAPASLSKVHPLGKAPVLELDGEMLLESGAILETLAERFGDGLLEPEKTKEAQAAYRFWMHYAEGSAMPPLLLSLIFRMMPRQPMPFFVKPVAKGIADKVTSSFIAPQLKTHFGFVDAHLAEHAWFAGDKLTAADIQMSFPCQAVASRSGAHFPHIARWVKRIEARPAYKIALEKGGPFELLG